MTTKAVNLKLEEGRIRDIKNIATVFHKTMTDVVCKAQDEYFDRIKKDPFYKLSANVDVASAEETNEILAEIDALSDDDLQISTVRKVRVS